jgi:hypothetical protein
VAARINATSLALNTPRPGPHGETDFEGWMNCSVFNLIRLWTSLDDGMYMEDASNPQLEETIAAALYNGAPHASPGAPLASLPRPAVGQPLWRRF